MGSVLILEEDRDAHCPWQHLPWSALAVVSGLDSKAPGGVGFLILITGTLQTHKASSGGPSCALR